MSHRLVAVLPLAVVLSLVACAPPTPVAQPVPSTTASGSAADVDVPTDEVHGWLVTATNSRLTGTARLCAVDDIWTDPDSEFAAIYVEENGGPPDGQGDAMWNVDIRGLRLDFYSGKYFQNYLDGDIVAGIGTSYTFQGTFTFTRNDEGVPLSGSGTGSGKIIYESGDADNNVPDTLSFTLTPIPEPDWCTR